MSLVYPSSIFIPAFFNISCVCVCSFDMRYGEDGEDGERERLLNPPKPHPLNLSPHSSSKFPDNYTITLYTFPRLFEQQARNQVNDTKISISHTQQRALKWAR